MTLFYLLMLTFVALVAYAGMMKLSDLSDTWIYNSSILL